MTKETKRMNLKTIKPGDIYTLDVRGSMDDPYGTAREVEILRAGDQPTVRVGEQIATLEFGDYDGEVTSIVI